MVVSHVVTFARTFTQGLCPITASLTRCKALTGPIPGTIKHRVSNALINPFLIYLRLGEAEDMEFLHGLVILRAVEGYGYQAVVYTAMPLWPRRGR